MDGHHNAADKHQELGPRALDGHNWAHHNTAKRAVDTAVADEVAHLRTPDAKAVALMLLRKPKNEHHTNVVVAF